MTNEELAAKHLKADLKSCKKGIHETFTPVFASSVLGGLIRWCCACGNPC